MLAALSTLNHTQQSLSNNTYIPFTYTITGSNYSGTPGSYPIHRK